MSASFPIFISNQEDMDILTALRLLQKARTEDLQSHHDEVLLMLADVSKRLKVRKKPSPVNKN
jgi:hypothetical protein